MDIVYSLSLLVLFTHVNGELESEEPVLYYYGIESSERGLPSCAARQACALHLRRYWRADALLRLCRCARRRRCDEPAPPARRVPINDRAHLQFCDAAGEAGEAATCPAGEAALALRGARSRPEPDELARLHRRGARPAPPEVVLACRCREPNYWQFHEERNGTALYRCASLPPCKSGDFCGNVDDDLLSLYQSCTCPKNHICVHDGGVAHLQISELLYSGRGRRARCRPLDDDSYEEY